MAADSRHGGLGGGRSRRGAADPGGVLARLGAGVHLQLPHQPLRAVRPAADVPALPGARGGRPRIPHAAAVPLRAPSALPRLHPRLLGGAGDERRPSALRHRRHRLHPRRHLVRGARYGRAVRRALPRLPRAGGPAAARPHLARRVVARGELTYSCATAPIQRASASSSSSSTSAFLRPERAGTRKEWSASATSLSIARAPSRSTIGSSSARSAKSSRVPCRNSIGTFILKRCAPR